MELMGVLETLKFFSQPVEILIYSDSQYIVRSVNDGHLERWIKTQDETKKNMDLWNEIYKLLQFHSVCFKWVKGHNKDEYNELADLLAQHAATCMNLNFDNGFIRDEDKYSI